MVSNFSRINLLLSEQLNKKWEWLIFALSEINNRQQNYEVVAVRVTISIIEYKVKALVCNLLSNVLTLIWPFLL